MRFNLLFFSLFLLLSCKNEVGYENPKFRETNFVSNYPKVNTSFSLNLAYDGGLVTATRSQGSIRQEAFSNALFIQADVSFQSDGTFDLKGQTDIWFIPFDVGAPVENLGIKKCLKYSCYCGSKPVTSSGECVINNSPAVMFCENESNECEGRCLGWSLTVDCITGQMIGGSPGGVIVKASDVIVIEPEWYDPSTKHPPIVFTAIEPD